VLFLIPKLAAEVKEDCRTFPPPKAELVGPSNAIVSAHPDKMKTNGITENIFFKILTPPEAIPHYHNKKTFDLPTMSLSKQP
tara:strand:+ start:32 stop:277 length:246 start_codon:yes stop_codon:yes gene_type:complete